MKQYNVAYRQEVDIQHSQFVFETQWEVFLQIKYLVMQRTQRKDQDKLFVLRWYFLHLPNLSVHLYKYEYLFDNIIYIYPT